MTYKIYFEDVEVGQEIPTFVRQTDLMHWNRFAAVNDEYVYLHMDDAAGQAAGQDSAFGMGALRLSYVLNALRDWIGDEAEIRELSMQFRAINNKNDVLTTRAVVVEKLPGKPDGLVRLKIDVINQHGASTSPGHALVWIPSRV